MFDSNNAQVEEPGNQYFFGLETAYIKIENFHPEKM